MFRKRITIVLSARNVGQVTFHNELQNALPESTWQFLETIVSDCLGKYLIT